MTPMEKLKAEVGFRKKPLTCSNCAYYGSEQKNRCGKHGFAVRPMNSCLGHEERGA
jgi:hypothetical protein